MDTSLVDDVNFGERLPCLLSAEQSQVFDGFSLQVWIALASGDASENLARFSRAVLREHEKGFRLFFRCARAVQHFFQEGHGSLGIAVHQASDGEHFQLFIGLRFRVGGLARRLTVPRSPKLCVFYPAALRIFLLEIGNRCQRGVSFPQFVFRVSLPIHCGIGLRAIQRSKLAEFLGGPVIAVFVERFAAIAVKFIEAFEALLLAVALFLFTVARFLFAVAFLLLTVTGLLIAVRAALFLPGVRVRRNAMGGNGLRHPRSD